MILKITYKADHFNHLDPQSMWRSGVGEKGVCFLLLSTLSVMQSSCPLLAREIASFVWTCLQQIPHYSLGFSFVFMNTENKMKGEKTITTNSIYLKTF